MKLNNFLKKYFPIIVISILLALSFTIILRPELLTMADSQKNDFIRIDSALSRIGAQVNEDRNTIQAITLMSNKDSVDKYKKIIKEAEEKTKELNSIIINKNSELNRISKKEKKTQADYDSLDGLYGDISETLNKREEYIKYLASSYIDTVNELRSENKHLKSIFDKYVYVESDRKIGFCTNSGLGEDGCSESDRAKKVQVILWELTLTKQLNEIEIQFLKPEFYIEDKQVYLQYRLVRVNSKVIKIQILKPTNGFDKGDYEVKFRYKIPELSVSTTLTTIQFSLR